MIHELIPVVYELKGTDINITWSDGDQAWYISRPHTSCGGCEDSRDYVVDDFRGGHIWSPKTHKYTMVMFGFLSEARDAAKKVRN